MSRPPEPGLLKCSSHTPENQVTSQMRRLSLLLLVATAGCHSYAQIHPSTVTPGQSVRVEIERQEAVRQVELLGSLDTSIQGTIRESSDRVVGLTIRDPNTNAGQTGFNTFVSFPWAQVIRVEEKRLSVARTGAMVAIGSVIVLAILNIADNSSGTNDPGGPDQQRVQIPIFSIGR